MIPGNFFQLVLVDHLDSYLFAREHMPSRFDDSKMAFAEGLFQIVHASNVAAIVFGRLNGVRLADHAAAVLHCRTRRDGRIGQHPNPDCYLPVDRREHFGATVPTHFVRRENRATYLRQSNFKHPDGVEFRP